MNPNRSARYLVTGGAGFIGSHLVHALVQTGAFVRVLDNFSTGSRENLIAVESQIELIQGDITDPQTVESAMQTIDYVLHQAALPSVPRSIQNPLATNHVNIVGTLMILQAARDCNVKRLVFAGSSSVYGDTEILPKHENMTPNPQSPYALTKFVGEQYCRLFTKLYGLETICLRYFNVFGPRQNPNSMYAAVIPKFITGILRNKSPCVHGDGNQTRDFTYVGNVVQANLAACSAELSGFAVCNIGFGARISINELIAEINGIVGTAIQPCYQAPRPGDVRHSLADISAAQKLLGYQPNYSLAQGLRETVRWYQTQSRTLFQTK